MSTPLLEVRGLLKQFGGLRALDGVDCCVPAGRIQAVIGPNGAGKTTFFNCVSGVDTPTDGKILFDGASIVGMAPHRIAEAGIARTWQTIDLFEDMTALHNVMVGRHCRTKCGMLRSAFRLRSQRLEERQIRSDALCWLELLGIADYADRQAGELQFLHQRRVELARALASEPRLLLLDEPAAGLNTKETVELAEIIRLIRSTGVTVLLVEHDMTLVMEISDDVLVLDHGVPIAQGPPREVQNDKQVIAIYLGDGSL